MEYGHEISLSELDCNNTEYLKIGDIIKNIKNDKYYIVIDAEYAEDAYYSEIEIYPIHCKNYTFTLKDNKENIFNQLNLFNISDKVEIKSLYKNSISLNHCDFDDSDDEYIYIGHVPIKKVSYIEIDIK